MGQTVQPKRKVVVEALVSLIVLTGILVAAASTAGAAAPAGEIVVKLEPGADIARVADDVDVLVVRTLLESRGIHVVRADPTGATPKPKDAVKALSKHPDVFYAELVTSRRRLDDDRFHAWPDGLATPVAGGQEVWTGQPALASLRLDDAHRVATGEGLVVAVLDTGVDDDHPALVGHLAPDGYDYVDDDHDPSEETDGRDDDGNGAVDEAFGHGTHTVGLVALVAPDAEILAYRVLDADGQGNPYLVAEAVNDAVAAGADVINVSFGMVEKPKSRVLRDAFKRAEKAGVVVVAAAGNDGVDTKRYPAESKGVIGVAALGREGDDLADFSNHGKKALVAAPGEDVVSTLPGGGYGAWSGTSMAAPIVTGQVALIAEHDPVLEVKKIIERVGKSSNKLRGRRKIEKGYVDILASLED